MKHFYSYFVAMTMLFAISCSKDNTEEDTNGGGDNGKPETVYTISVNPGSTTVPAEGDTYSTIVYSSAGWTLSGDISWCDPSKTSGSNGETVTFMIEPNTTSSERNVTYTFRCGDKTAKLTITQKQNDALTVTKSKYEVDAGGDDIWVEVKADISFDYEIAPNCRDWITLLQTKTLTTSTLVFKIAENPETSRREGTIIIRSGDLSETISVYQAGAAPAIVISPDKYIVSDQGETIKVEVNSNVEYTVEMPAVDWITENAVRSISSHTHYYTISPNESDDQRSAQIIFKSKENSALRQVVTVTQISKTLFIPDANFKAYLLTKCDMDGDGILTKSDAAAYNKTYKGNAIFNINDKNITSLEGIQYFTVITELHCNNTKLTTLDVSKNTDLQELECSNNKLTSLDVSNNPALKSLMCHSNRLTTLDLRNNPLLEYLIAGDNELTRLDISKNPELYHVSCDDNNLTELDVTKNLKLLNLYCNNNRLFDLDISRNTLLRELVCHSNSLTTLDVSTLDVRNPELNTVELSPMPTLNILYVKTGCEIEGITVNRSEKYIPVQTKIEYK